MCQNLPERHAAFDDVLDECYPVVKVCGITFYPSDILYDCDPIAYRVALNDFLSSECEDGRHTFTTNPACDYCGMTQTEEE